MLVHIWQLLHIPPCRCAYSSLGVCHLFRPPQKASLNSPPSLSIPSNHHKSEYLLHLCRPVQDLGEFLRFQRQIWAGWHIGLVDDADCNLFALNSSETIRNGSPSRSLLPLLQEQALPQITIQPWCPRLKGSRFCNPRDPWNDLP